MHSHDAWCMSADGHPRCVFFSQQLRQRSFFSSPHLTFLRTIALSKPCPPSPTPKISQSTTASLWTTPGLPFIWMAQRVSWTNKYRWQNWAAAGINTLHAQTEQVLLKHQSCNTCDMGFRTWIRVLPTLTAGHTRHIYKCYTTECHSDILVQYECNRTEWLMARLRPRHDNLITNVKGPWTVTWRACEREHWENQTS